MFLSRQQYCMHHLSQKLREAVRPNDQQIKLTLVYRDVQSPRREAYSSAGQSRLPASQSLCWLECLHHRSINAQYIHDKKYIKLRFHRQMYTN